MELNTNITYTNHFKGLSVCICNFAVFWRLVILESGSSWTVMITSAAIYAGAILVLQKLERVGECNIVGGAGKCK